MKSMSYVWAAGVSLLVCVSRAHGQSLPLGPYTSSQSSAIVFEIDQYGVLSSTGTLGVGAGDLALSGIGTRLFWYPGKAAFRAGTVNSSNTTSWDDANIGQGSVAFGSGTTASGANSAAFGSGAAATSNFSFAAGVEAEAAGDASAAFANGYALGSYSFATGFGTQAKAYDSFVIGQYNLGGGTATEWVGTDPLFEVGNGTTATPSDALVVYKNGNAAFQGVVTVAPGGSIPMYSGN